MIIASSTWRMLSGASPLARRFCEVVGDGEDAAEVVRGMAPLGGQPGVVVVQPADDAADVPGGLDRVEPEGGARHPRAVRDQGALDQRAEVLGAFREAQRQQAAAEGIHQAVAGGVQASVESMR